MRAKRTMGIAVTLTMLLGLPLRWAILLPSLLMTALTTLLGTLPMMLATGAGAASRNHLGTTEFWGMFASVAFGILLVPGLYALFQTWRERVKRFFSYISTTNERRRRLKATASTAG